MSILLRQSSVQGPFSDDEAISKLLTRQQHNVCATL